jgi:hypothetical protein
MAPDVGRTFETVGRTYETVWPSEEFMQAVFSFAAAAPRASCLEFRQEVDFHRYRKQREVGEVPTQEPCSKPTP